MLSLGLRQKGDGPLRILCLGAHSDDIEIGCGGTILSLLDQHEAIVNWTVFSSTDERAVEAKASARAFLAEAYEYEISVKQHRDGFFPFHGEAIKDDFEELKSVFSPDLVFTHYRHDRHQDHRLVSDLAWNTFRNHLILEYEIPKYDGDLGIPNLFVPLQEVVCSRKIGNLLECFPSQRGKHWFDEQTFMSILRLRGMEANSPTRFAEAFHCRKAVIG